MKPLLSITVLLALALASVVSHNYKSSSKLWHHSLTTPEVVCYVYKRGKVRVNFKNLKCDFVWWQLLVFRLDQLHPEVWEKNSKLRISANVDWIPGDWFGNKLLEKLYFNVNC